MHCDHSDAQAAEREQQMALEELRLAERSAAIRHMIGVISGKGGVGKTTVAAGLAQVLAEQGQSVGLLDTDISGPNVPLMMGVDEAMPQPGALGGLVEPVLTASGVRVMSMGILLQDRDVPVIWRGPLRSAAVRQLVAEVAWGQLDYLIIDLPPGTGDEPLTVAQSLTGLEGMVVVSTPQRASLQDCRKAINFARRLDVPLLGMVENMSGFACPHCGAETPVFGQGGAEKTAKEMGIPFLGRLPLVGDMAESPEGRLLLEGSPQLDRLHRGFERIAAFLPG